jgi:hypothetical protein
MSSPASEALRYVKDERKSMILPLLLRDAMLASLDAASGEGLVGDCLRKLGYATDMAHLTEARQAFRKMLDYWASDYQVFAGGARATVLRIRDGRVFDGDAEIENFKYADDHLEWTADGNPSSASLDFEYSLPMKGAALDPRSYWGPQCAGDYRRARAASAAVAASPAPGAARGKVRVFSSAGFATPESVDPIDTWTGEYALTITNNGVSSRSILSIDGTTGDVRLDTQLLANTAFAMNTLTWNMEDSNGNHINATSGNLSFNPASGPQAQGCSGMIWSGTNQPSDPNASGTLLTTPYSLSTWVGVYATSTIADDGTSSDGEQLEVKADDSVVYGTNVFMGCSYIPDGNLLTWDTSGGNTASGALVFTLGPPSTFLGSIWSTGTKPKSDNLRGTLNPAPVDDPSVDSANKLNNITIAGIVVGALVPVFLAVGACWLKKRNANREAARGNQAAAQQQANGAAQQQEHAVAGAAAATPVLDQVGHLDTSPVHVDNVAVGASTAEIDMSTQHAVVSAEARQRRVSQVIDSLKKQIVDAQADRDAHQRTLDEARETFDRMKREQAGSQELEAQQRTIRDAEARLQQRETEIEQYQTKVSEHEAVREHLGREQADARKLHEANQVVVHVG